MVSEEQTTSTGAKGAHRASVDLVQNPRRVRRFSVRRKTEAVLRLLRGEDLETLSRELGVVAHELSMWRERFLVSGQAAMKKRPANARDEEVKRLKTKIGELTMDNELLYERIDAVEAGRPFSGRRSK